MITKNGKYLFGFMSSSYTDYLRLMDGETNNLNKIRLV